MGTQIHLNNFKVLYKQEWTENTPAWCKKPMLYHQHPPNLDIQTPTQEERQRTAQRPGHLAQGTQTHAISWNTGRFFLATAGSY